MRGVGVVLEWVLALIVFGFLLNRCACCGTCGFCTEELAEGNVSVQASIALTNEGECDGAQPDGLDCTGIDGTLALTIQSGGAVPYPTDGDALTGTSGEGMACLWVYVSPEATNCESPTCENCTCEPFCPDDGDECDPLVPAECDGSDCEPDYDLSCNNCGLPPASPEGCSLSPALLEPVNNEDRCFCNETSPGSGIFACDCSAVTCAPVYACAASLTVGVYLYSADGNTKRVLYVTVDLEGATYHGAVVKTPADVGTFNCRDEFVGEVISLSLSFGSSAPPKLCSIPTTITISFL